MRWMSDQAIYYWRQRAEAVWRWRSLTLFPMLIIARISVSARNGPLKHCTTQKYDDAFAEDICYRPIRGLNSMNDEELNLPELKP